MRDDTTGGQKVGEVAAATGLTVRTLHYYEEIGLVSAAERSDGGHRLYGEDDLARLYRVTLLRRLGLPLAQIGSVLDDPAWSLDSALRSHLQRLEERLERERLLHNRLTRLLAALADDDEIGGDLMTVLEDMTMLDDNVQRRISILVYADLEAAFEFLKSTFGLGPGELTRDGDGKPVHGELQAGDGVIWLHPESDEFALSSPRSLGAGTGMLAILVDDVDAHFAHASEHGADIVYEPVDQPYGYREYGARDIEGHLWSFMKPIG